MKVRFGGLEKESAMNQIFLEERCREKVKDLLNEGVMSQEYYRNRTNHPTRFHHLARSAGTILKAIISILSSKKKHPVPSHRSS